MSDFFERNKSRYEKKEKKENELSNDSSIQSVWGAGMEFAPEIEAKETKEKKSVRTYFTYNQIKNLKWEYVENEISGKPGKYGDTLVKSGAWIVKGFIPNKYARPIIKYYESDYKLSLSGSRNNEPMSSSKSAIRHITFSFKGGKFNIYITDRLIDNVSIRGALMLDRCFLGKYSSNFSQKCRNFMEVHYFNKSLKNNKQNNFNNNNVDSIGISMGNRAILSMLGDDLIRKGKEHGVVSYKGSKALKRAFGILLRRHYSFKHDRWKEFKISGNVKTLGEGDILNVLIHYLKYPIYVKMLEGLKSEREYIDHLDKVLHYKLFGSRLENRSNMSRTFNHMFLVEKDMDVIVKKISGFESKGKIKKVISSLISDCQFSLLDKIYLYKGYIDRDWLIDSYNKEFFKSTHFQYSAEISSHAVKRRDFRKFCKDYLKSGKKRRDFYEKMFNYKGLYGSDFANSIRDTISMYYSIRPESRPTGVGLNLLHDHLAMKLNRANRFLQPHIASIDDEYEYDYSNNELYELEGEEVNGYTIVIPKTAGEVRDGGIKLNNCLSSYVERIKLGNSFIFYLSKDDNPIYAVEVQRSSGKHIIQQFYGNKNSLPDKEDFEKFELYIKERFKDIDKKVRRTDLSLEIY